MGKTDFEEYLRKQDADTEIEAQVDWGKQRDEWLEYLETFYKKVKGWLSKYKDSGVTCEDREKNIDEDHIGKYRARSLHIHVRNKEVVLDPVGTNLIGAKGRIDMIGNAGTVRFLLVDRNLTGQRISVTARTESEPDRRETEGKDEQIEWVWKIATPPPRIKHVDINADSFFDALMEVINA